MLKVITHSFLKSEENKKKQNKQHFFFLNIYNWYVIWEIIFKDKKIGTVWRRTLMTGEIKFAFYNFWSLQHSFCCNNSKKKKCKKSFYWATKFFFFESTKISSFFCFVLFFDFSLLLYKLQKFNYDQWWAKNKWRIF